jgi:outer membrane protein TolC
MRRLAITVLSTVLLAGSVGAPVFAADPVGFTILDAVRDTVALNPLIKAAGQDVEISKARRQQATGAFDLIFDWSGSHSLTHNPLTDYDEALAAAAGIVTDSQSLHTTVLSTGAQKLYRSGISITPTFDITSMADNLEDIGGVNVAHLDFQVDVPLRRGKGRDVVAAPETAAGLVTDATVLEMNETIAGMVFNTASSYWQYAAALKVMVIRRESEQRGQEFLDNIRELIKADRLPGSEAHQAVANVAEQASARIAASQQVVEARQSLAYAMGKSALETLSLPNPSEAFPSALELPAAGDVSKYIEEALQSRAGYLATEKRSAGADVLRKAAANSLLPRMDLVLGGGYSGLYSGTRPDQYFHAVFGRVGGPDVSAGLQYTFPHANNSAKGQLAEAEADYQKSQLLRSDASNKIAADVVAALSGVQTSAAALEKARASANEYQEALQGSREKLRLGAGSVIDLLTIEARLTASQLDLVNAHLAYALAIVRLRYTTGTMLGPDPRHPSLERDVFFQAPPVPGVKK